MGKLVHYDSAIQYQLLLDLSARARGGIVIYPIVWFVTSVWVGMPSQTPLEFLLISIGLVSISILRSIHYLLLKKYAQSHTLLMCRILVGLILLVAITWGLLSAWVMVFSPYEHIKYPYMVILSAVAIGGTSVLGISRTVANLYPFFIFLPGVVSILIIGGSENNIMALLALLSTVYVIDAAKTTRKDYESAVWNSLLAERRSAQLEEVSVTDELTGLKNRKYLNEKLAMQWSQCQKDQLPISILMYDLDHFKLINDQFGHLEGDNCLKLIATMLKNQVNQTNNIVARFGGEEFIIVMPNADLTQAMNTATQLIDATRKLNFSVGNECVKLTTSIGVASSIPSVDSSYEKLISSADKALYQAKSDGRNGVSHRQH